MSGIGSTRARKERTIQDRVSESLTEGDKSLIADLKRFSDDSGSESGNAGESTNNSPTSPAGNYIARKGDTMLGPLALSPPLDFTIDIDADNTINISPLNDNNQYSSNIQLEDVPTSTTLDIIAGATFDGQILILRTFAPNPITISQGTVNNGGNIQTPDDTDVILGDLQMVVLVFDEALRIGENTGGTWRLLNTFGTGAVTADASVATLGLQSTIDLLPTVPVDFDNNTILGIGIIDRTDDQPGVFQLTGGIFQINSSISISESDPQIGAGEAEWKRADNVNMGSSTDVGTKSRVYNSKSNANFSSTPMDAFTIDATNEDVFIQLNITSSTGSDPQLEKIGTWAQIFSIGTGDVGGGANTALSNLITTEINAALLPNITNTLDFGSELLAWRIGHFKEIEFPTGSSEPNASSDTGISKLTSSGAMAFNVDTNGAGYQWFFEGVVNWNMNSTALSGSNIILSDTLTINDSAGDPSLVGEFRTNGIDVEVFSGNAVRNLSNIGVAAGGANVALSNLSLTAINQDLLPAGTVQRLGSPSKPWIKLEMSANTTGGIFFSNSGAVKIARLGNGLLYDVNIVTGVHQFKVEGEVKVEIGTTETTTRTILPFMPNTYNLGSLADFWNDVFADDFINVSLSKFKKNIVKLDDHDCLNVCKNLPTVEFQWNEKFKDLSQLSEEEQESKKEEFNKKHVGFLADKLHELVPNATNGDGHSISAVIGLLLGGVRELESRLQKVELDKV